MSSRAVCLCLALLLAATAPRGHAADAVTPFEFKAPPSFEAPRVSRASMGTTYAWLANERPLRLTITVMPAGEISARVGRLSDVQCINLFLSQLREAHTGFFVAAQTRPLSVGESEFTQFRWTGERDGTALTGVLACGLVGSDYLAIDFLDALQTATRSFPEIRAALRGLLITAASTP